MRLVARRIRPDEFVVGSIIYFDYDRPSGNVTSRVGWVDFISDEAFPPYIRLWDFSLDGGPKWRSYSIKGLRNLSVIEEAANLPADGLTHYIKSLFSFGRKLFGINT